MTIFNVLVREDADAARAAEGALFVPDKFSRMAFVFGPLWLMRHRVWLGFLIYCACIAATAGAVVLLRLPLDTFISMSFILALLTGFEGQAWRRASLERRGFRPADIVSAPTQEDAEHIFFARWPQRTAASAPARAAAPGPTPGAGALGSEVLGLFPEAGALR